MAPGGDGSENFNLLLIHAKKYYILGILAKL